VSFKSQSYVGLSSHYIGTSVAFKVRHSFLFLISSVSGGIAGDLAGTQTCVDMSGIGGGANPMPMAAEGNAASGPLLCKFIDSSGQDITRQLTQQPNNKKTKKTTSKIASRRPSVNSDASAVVVAVTDGDNAVNCEGGVDPAPTVDNESKGRTMTEIVDGLKLFLGFKDK
jgi:hypothetical protein